MTIKAGDKFNFWTAVHHVDQGNRGKSRWLFRCDCGTERVLATNYIQRGRSRSCGCDRAPRHDPIKATDRFARWTAIKLVDVDERRGRRWLFRCDCGNERVLRGYDLRRGFSKSCGCLPKTRGDSIKAGDTFNNWTAIKFVGAQENKANRRWLFRCTCGNERIRLAGSVRFGGSKSCGCIRKLPVDDRRVNALIKSIKRGAVIRKINFALSKSDVAELAIKQNWKCAKTGIDLDFTKRSGERKPFGPTIDRIENSRGYEPDNIQLVCNLYNYCKNQHSDADVLLFAQALVAKAKI